MKRVLLLFGGIVAAAFARGDYATLEIAQSGAMADYIRFESRSWAEDATGEGGRLQGNVVWTGEHVIWSDLYIPSGVTLTMNPGTVVRFREGTRIKVEDGGRLIITGETGNEVVLKGYEDATKFTGIVLQSSAATYSDNSQVIVEGFTFGKYAAISISDTSAFTGDGQALVPVTLSGSRDTAFSFDWVAETNGVAFAKGTMTWNNVSQGTKNIVVSFPDGLPGCETFTVRAECLRCCTASKGSALVKLSGYIISDIAAAETMADYIPFESDEWNLAQGGDCGRLTANAVWEGEHVITSDLYIPAGVTLTLTANTVVKFSAGTRIKIEDGGTLKIVGAQGNDVVLRGVDGETKFGGIVKMTNGTFTDNSYVQVAGFSFSAFANVALNNSETFRSSGLALIPVTVSGSRTTSFSIDWVAETNGVPYKTGTLSWGTVNDGTRNISINFGHELDGCTEFDVRVAVNRACSSSPSSCKVKIRDFDEADVVVAEAMADYIPFESRAWAEGMSGEGGRLTANTVWEGAHTIVSDVYIPAGVTLTLVAGADIAFCEGTRIKIEDGGALNIVGANGNDVIFHAAEGVRSFVGIVKMANGTYTDNMYVQYKDTPYSNYPYVTVHESSTYRDKGKVYIPLTLSGSTRNQSFNVDWETDKGDRGTITWNSSSDGTKLIEVPIDATLTGGTVKHKVTLTAARGCNTAVSEAEIIVYEFDYSVTENVALSDGATDSPDFAINGEIKMQPVFLNESEPIAFSGRWQKKVPPEDTVVRLSVESDNGIEQLATYDGSETGDYTWKASDYRVGYYTLRHEIIEKSSGGVLDVVTKSFSIVDEDDVVMHGGTLTQNETWKAGKTHVVYETVIVPSIYTLFIEPGAIVKFMTGTGIDISQGGALFANAIIFTHIDDDTIGGDTLSDGYTVAPVMDSYALNGNFTFGADTELRYITQSAAISGTINDQRVLSRGSTYKVSGTVTIANGASLTIPSGTILKMEAGARLNVSSGGRLIAKGTRSAPIVITSIKDDSYSGDTNGDGGATLPSGGDWYGIWVDGTAEMSYTTMMYAGPDNERGIIQTQNSGRLALDNCVIAHARYDGIWNWGGYIAATNTIIVDTGYATAPYRGSLNEYVNCIFYGNNVGLCYWSHWSGNPVYKNCVFDECGLGWCETGSSSYTNPQFRDAVKISNSLFYNPEGYGLQTCDRVGKNGNIWGDPLFVDLENFDFRVVDGSPCVDAADGTAAPELDLYGQPRLTLLPEGQTAGVPDQYGEYPDIGVCEVMPRNVTSDIDLTAKGVRADAEAVAGQLVFIKWEVANIGGTYVNDSWRDTISLVSENGQEIVLGDKMTKSAISVGGSAFCSAYFTLPAIAEGVWYPKVNVNNFHDIFEGTLYDNNVLVSDTGINVSISKVESEGKDGVISGGVPTVLKFTLDATGGNRMVRLDVPAGVNVSYGFGFVPRGANASGKIVSSGSEVLFKVPDGVTDVYVSLESDKTVEYAMTFEDGNVQIVSVSPNSLPSSGSVRVTISGAGFDESASVVLVNGDESVSPAEVKYEDANTLVATIDCGELVGGRVYGVKVEGDVGTATMENAISVAKVEGKGILALSYDIPSSVRAGRVFTFTVTCKNVGNADLCNPLVTVSDSGSDAVHPLQFSLDGVTYVNGFMQFLMVSPVGAFNGISPNKDVTITMYAKMPPVHDDVKGVLIRANSENDDLSSCDTELRRYVTPAMLTEGEKSNDEQFKSQMDKLCETFGNTNGEFVRGLNTVARDYYADNGAAIQLVGDLIRYELSDADDHPLAASASKNLLRVNSSRMRNQLFAVDLTTGAYLFTKTGERIFLNKTDTRLADVTFEGKKVALVAHGWNNSMTEKWVVRMASALHGPDCDFDYVVVVNWEEEADSWYVNPWGASKHITEVAEKVSLQLIDFKIEPSKCTFIGHSFGSHLASKIAMYLPSRLKRHIGLDTATGGAINDMHEINSSCAETTEYYRSSYWAGFDEPYADYNFVVCDSGGFTAAGSREIFGTISDHGYSYNWLIDNILNGKNSGLGFWFDPKKSNVDRIGHNTGSYIGVIYGPNDHLECAYAFDDDAATKSKYGENPAFSYPGHKSTWTTLHNSWTHAVDLDIANGVRIQNKVKTGMEVSYQVDVIDHVARDVRTIKTALWNKRLKITLTDKATGNVIPTNWDREQVVSDNINGAIVFENNIVQNGNSRDVIIHFTVTPLEFNQTNPYSSMSYTWVEAADLYDADNTFAQEITVERSDGPVAAINGYSAPDFVIKEPVHYSSEEKFEEAVNEGKTHAFKFASSSSDPGERKSIRQTLWRRKSTDTQFIGEDKTYKGEYSATTHAQYPITLTIINSAFEQSTVSGYLEIVPIVDGEEKPLEEPKSVDPNEMGGIMGRGDGDTQRYVKPGEWMTYTVYFENKSTATAAAQEVKVSNPLSLYLDWSTFEMGEVAFNNQIDLGLSGKQNGTSEVTMNGTSYLVRSKVTLDKTEGKVDWYLRIVDPSTPTTWPDDVFAGFLPPNDATYRGEGHLTYRIKVRDDAPAGVKITNAASIIFDYNDPIETNPAWWNQVAKVVSVEGSDGKAIKVSVDPSWIKTHVGESATDAEVATALNATGANGLKVWTSVALGLDPENPDDKFLVDVPQNADENSVAIKALGGELPTNAWMAIQYRLDRDATGGGETSSGTAQSGQGFSIDIGGAPDPTGIYQVKAVLSDDEGTSATEVPAANQIGILRKTAANKREIVPVPWTKFAAGAEDIAVSNLVKTAGLTAGDKLYVYDDSAKRYATWELQSDKTWKPVKTVKMVNGKLEVQTADSPEVATVKRGSGVWLERQDTSKPIALVGQYEAVGATTTVAGGTATLPSWNLIASPAISNWNLNAICEGVGVKDRIIVPTGKEPRIYTRDAGNTKWGYITYEANAKGIVKPVRKEDDVEVAPGTGFWYISEGGAPVIKW